jgi:hypothetical protein
MLALIGLTVPLIKLKVRHSAMPLPKYAFARNAVVNDCCGDLSEKFSQSRLAQFPRPIRIDLIRRLLIVLNVMRLLVQILIIAGLIYLGWNKPFKEQVAQANRTITTKLHNLGSALQKHEDPSVRRP